MKFVLKSATVLDQESPFHEQQVDLLIHDGRIEAIADTLAKTKDVPEIVLENLHVSQGWFDSSVSFGEPGYEERETIAHGLEVAAKSGFTSIALQPGTLPVTDTATNVGYLKAKALGSPVTLHPIGALTQKQAGVDLAELYDMQQHGAIAFGDYKKAIKNPNLLKLALLYVQNFGGLVQSFPQEEAIAAHGMVHEGDQSILLGLKGIPALAETLQINRDLYLLEYTGGKLHIPTISTARSVALIRAAKAKGLQVSCSIAAHHLSLTHAVLGDFDTRYKVSPPLRTTEDCKALLEGVQDGTIDMITSDHAPIAIEDKKMEFDHADFGTLGLESIFGVLNSKMATPKAITMLTGGKSIFGIQNIPIAVGNKAELTLFDPHKSYTFSAASLLSTSKNSAFLGHDLKGFAYGIVANDQLVLHHDANK